MRQGYGISSQYSNRLRDIQEELTLVRASVKYVSENLNTAVVSRIPEFSQERRAALIGIEKRLEDTYFIRLTAEFEGILKDHLTVYYPVISVPDDAKFDWLISRVFKPTRIVQPALRIQIEEIRQYRMLWRMAVSPFCLFLLHWHCGD